MNPIKKAESHLHKKGTTSAVVPPMLLSVYRDSHFASLTRKNAAASALSIQKRLYHRETQGCPSFMHRADALTVCDPHKKMPVRYRLRRSLCRRCRNYSPRLSHLIFSYSFVYMCLRYAFCDAYSALVPPSDGYIAVIVPIVKISSFQSHDQSFGGCDICRHGDVVNVAES